MSSLTLILLVFLVAMIYASVGHGGASGYLAVLSLLAYEPASMAASALLLNLLVAGTAALSFWRAGHGSLRLLWPFLVSSVPMAFVGGWLRVSPQAYAGLLALMLLIAAWRLCLSNIQATQVAPFPQLPVALAAGSGIGFLSGIVGIGGGILLSPLMLLCRWADAKRTAAASAGFILANSGAGLVGRIVAGQLHVGPLLPFIGSAFLGGLIGSRLGASHFSNVRLCRLLTMVLVFAAIKLVLSHG